MTIIRFYTFKRQRYLRRQTLILGKSIVLCGTIILKRQTLHVQQIF